MLPYKTYCCKTKIYKDRDREIVIVRRRDKDRERKIEKSKGLLGEGEPNPGAWNDWKEERELARNQLGHCSIQGFND